jgi:adsorption protein B
MRMRDRRAPLAILVLAAAYGAVIAWAVATALHAWRGEPVAPFAPAWLLGINTVLLLWRLAVRVAFTAREGGWRLALVAPARFIVGNLIGLAAAPRALATYLPILAGRAPTWDKTVHEFPLDASRPA